MGCEQPLPGEVGSVDAGEPRQALRHRRAQFILQLVDVGDDLVDRLLVEGERLGHVVEQPEVVDDEPVALARRDPVGATDRLEERVVSQRAVEVHALEVRRVEPGEELGGDDDDLEGVGRIAEPIQQRGLVVLGPAESVPPLLWCALADVHDDVACLDGQFIVGERVEGVLVEDARLLVDGDDHRPEAFGRDLLEEVLPDVGDDGRDPRRSLDEQGEPTGSLRDLLTVFVAEVTGELLEFLVEGGTVDPEIDGSCLEPQRQGGFVADRLLERVAVEVAAGILLRTEGEEGVPVAGVDRRTGQPEEEGVRQGVAHLPAEVALLGAVGLVDEDDDVVARVELTVGLARTCASS